MAERENMADATPGPGPEGQAQLPPGIPKAAAEISQLNWGGKNPLESVRGQLADIPDWLEEERRRITTSEFEIVRGQYELLSRVNPDRLTPDQQAELQNLRIQLRTDIINFKGNLEQERRGENEGRGETILKHVRDAALRFFRSVRSARPQERHGGMDREEIMRRGRQHGYYEEVVFDDSPRLKELQSRYGRLPTYIFEGFVQEVDKEVSRRPSPPLNPLAEEEYRLIKQRRERERGREQKYTETPAYWGGRYYELLWPESSRDMIDSTLDFVKDRISEVGNRDVGTVNKLLEDIRGKVVELLESCRVRLNGDEWFLGENKKITETDPNFLRARAFGEGVTDVLGNEKVMYKGNTEYGPQYKDRFASEFIAHHDEMYLGNPKVAYILHRLTKVKDGTYWLGHGWDVEKVEEGEITDYRREIEEEVLEDAATHDLFLSDAMTRGLYLDRNGRSIEGKDGRPIGAFAYREGGNLEGIDLRFSFDDNIETLLLDPGNQIRQRIVASGDAAALARYDLRVGVFRETKERLDQEDRLAGITAEDRSQKIRLRILQKMKQKTKLSYLAGLSQQALSRMADARASGDIRAYDQIMWQWVKDYNEYRIDFRLPKWYPTKWDRVRWNIDRSTKVLDRSLSEEEFEAMFEPVRQDQSLDEDIVRQHKEDARFGFQLARSYEIFHMQDTMLGGMRARLRDPKTGEYCGRLPDDETSLALGLIRQVGVDAQGNPVYETVDPNRKMIRVFDVVQARLQLAIGKEAAVINQAKVAKAAAEALGDLNEIRAKTAALRDLLVDSQFAATHALKEKGLVEGKLPVWSYNFLDNSTIYAFTEVLADYGVEIAPGVRISHNNKKEFYEYMERGRRALKAEVDRAAQEFMVGTYPVYERDIDGTILTELDKNGNPAPVRAVSLLTAASDFGDPGELSERFRVVSKGAVKEDTQVTEAQFNTSTSGGVVFTEAIPWAGDLGFYPLLVWLGVTDIRSLHSYIKRQDEYEYHRHRFFDPLDPVQNAKAQAAAYIARRALLGGVLTPEINGQQPTPGFLKEPFHGAFKVADVMRQWYQSDLDRAVAQKMIHMTAYLDLLVDWRRDKIIANNAELERLRQMAYLDFGGMNKTMTDNLYNTTYDVIDYFQWALKATKEVESNRIGRAPRNWEYDNTLKWYAFRREMRKAMQRPDPQKGFVLRHKYSPEVASEISIRMMETVLEDAGYIILKYFERERLAREGAQILSKALTEEDRRDGFLLPDGRSRGFVIPPEKDWPKLPEHIRLALENTRRRGLLEFMTEEGYSIKDGDGREIQILGDKIPPYVQQEYIQKEQTRPIQHKNKRLKLSAAASKFLEEK